MQKARKLTEDRILVTPERFIKPLLHRRKMQLQIEAAAVGDEPITWKQVQELDFQPFEVGQKWGAQWDTVWFRMKAKVPEDWAGEKLVALLDLSYVLYEGFGREGMVYIDGLPVTAVNRNRSAVPIVEQAKGGETIEFYVEAAANPHVHTAWGFGHMVLPDYGGEEQFELGQAELATRDDEAFALLMDFTCAEDAMRELPWEPRRGQLLRALNEACSLLENGSAESIPAARQALRGVLSKKNGDTNHRLTAVGHAHIDTAWLWPLRETIRKCARTFATVLDHMQRYPEFRFSCSQPVQYLWMKHHYPSIYQGIQEAVKRGQWDVVGSMWVESDCNIPSGESLVRQVLHGKQFFEEEFGIETKDLWLPDVFGYAASLPQILRKSQIDHFLTQKISWSDTNRFPHHTFYWQGLDGSRIFTHFPPVDTYNAELSATELTRSVRQFQENDRATEALVPFGHGDGGGGPTIEMLERARRYEDFEGLPQVRMGTVEGFFADCKADAIEPPVWKGELYLELHRGTLTSQAYVKRMNRKCELLLRDAEMLDVIARSLGAGDLLDAMPATQNVPVYDLEAPIAEKTTWTQRALDRAWKLLLLNQFHDIIPGSSIHWVYQDCRVDYTNIETIATSVRDAALAEIASRIDTSEIEPRALAWNTLSHTRSEVIQLPNGEQAYITLPSCGYHVVSASETPPEGIVPVEVTESAEEIVLENGLIRAVLNREGQLVSLFDLEHDREVIAEGQQGNQFQLHQDYPVLWNNWDVDLFHKDNVEILDQGATVELTSVSPLKAVLTLRREFGASTLDQAIALTAGARRLDFHTKIDWQESDRLLKVAFPVAIDSYRASYEIQYGHVERPTHANTSWDRAKFEVPAHKWADLSESDYGVALLNRAKYAYDIDGNVMHLTLLKAGNAPDPVADKGIQEMSYAIFPHAGNLQQGKVIEEGYAFNVPVITTEIERQTGDLPTTKSFFATDKAGVFIEAVKQAERSSDVVLRLYEAYQSRGEVRVSAALPETVGVQEVNLLERDAKDLEVFQMGQDNEVAIEVKPFEIHTICYRQNTKSEKV